MEYFSGFSSGLDDVVEAEVEVAAAVDFGGGCGLFVQMADAFVDEVGLVFEFAVGVRGGDDVGGAGVGGDAEHFEADFFGGGAVVHAPEDVAVNVGQFIVCLRRGGGLQYTNCRFMFPLVLNGRLLTVQGIAPHVTLLDFVRSRG